jgi:hypothetical protein
VQLLATSTDQHVVHPLVAQAVLALAVPAIQRGQVEVITVPVRLDGGPGTVQILISPATQLSVRSLGGPDEDLSDLEHDAIERWAARDAGAAADDGPPDDDPSASFVDFDLYIDPSDAQAPIGPGGDASGDAPRSPLRGHVLRPDPASRRDAYRWLTVPAGRRAGPPPSGPDRARTRR